MKKRGDNRHARIFAILVVTLFVMSFVSAGVGLRWDRESALVKENKKGCLTYQVYNPWDNDAYAMIRLSEEFDEIISSQSSETQFIPSHTPSSNPIPIEFCFKTPNIYARDCLVGDSLICEQSCEEDLRTYEGKVEVVEMNEQQVKAGGSGGSATEMSVSAPIRVRIQCVPHARNWSVVYFAIALISGIWLTLNIVSSRGLGKKKLNLKK